MARLGRSQPGSIVRWGIPRLSADTDVSANVAILLLTENSASIAHDRDVQGVTDVLTISTNQAAITIGGDTNVSANTDALTLVTYQADSALTYDVQGTVVPLSITPYTGTISLDRDIQGAVKSFTLSTYTSSVSTTTLEDRVIALEARVQDLETLYYLNLMSP